MAPVAAFLGLTLTLPSTVSVILSTPQVLSWRHAAKLSNPFNPARRVLAAHLICRTMGVGFTGQFTTRPKIVLGGLAGPRSKPFSLCTFAMRSWGLIGLGDTPGRLTGSLRGS